MVNKWTKPNRFWLFPDYCLLCSCQAFPARTVCQPCRDDLPRIQRCCQHCAAPLLSGTTCSVCMSKPPVYNRTVTTFSYSYPVDSLIKALKYQQKLPIARLLAEELANSILHNQFVLPECLIPVPLHPYRLIKRGYNQSLEIARILARYLNIPLDYQLLIRSRPTRPQFQLKPEQRLKNIRGAFRLNARPPYRSVAIVDDVMTTGATMNEIAKILKKAGVEHIQVWLGARA